MTSREIAVFSQKGLPRKIVKKFKEFYLKPLINVLDNCSSKFREKTPIKIFLAGPVDVAHREEYYPKLGMVYFNPEVIFDEKDYDYSFQALLHGTFHGEVLGWEEFKKRHEKEASTFINIFNPKSKQDPLDFLEEGFAELISFDELRKAVKGGLVNISVEDVIKKTKTRFPSYSRAEEVCRKILKKKQIGKLLIDVVKLDIKLDLNGIYDLIEPIVHMDKKEFTKLVWQFNEYHPDPKKEGRLLCRFKI